MKLSVEVIDKETKKSVLIIANDYDNLKTKASEKLDNNVLHFARVLDGTEISDNDSLSYYYEKFTENNPNDEFQLLAIVEKKKKEVMNAIPVQIVDKENKRRFLLLVRDFATLKRKANEKMGETIECFARMTDTLKLDDDEGLQSAYDSFRATDKKTSSELLLVALKKNEDFTRKDKLSFQIPDYYNIKNLINKLKEAEKVDMCFLVDCTGSMEPYMNELKKDIIHLITNRVQVIFPEFKLRISFVGYRDYDSKGKDVEGRIEKLDFKNKTHDFKNFVEELKPTGGGDFCEDIFGGLEAVGTLDWKNSSRILIHICDAPCHGKRFYDGNLIDNDDHPNGDPKGLKIENLLKKLSDLKIDYYFTEVKEEYTKKMIEEFNKELDLIPESRRITKFKIKDERDLLDTLVTTVTLTIQNTQTLTMEIDPTIPRKLKIKPIDKTKLNFNNSSNFKEYDVDLFEFTFNGMLNTFKELMKEYEENEFSRKIETFMNVKRETTKMKICETPFSKGNLRFAYAAMLHRNSKYEKFVAKNSLYDNKNADSYTNCKQTIFLQIISKYLANKFIEDTKSEMKVKFLDVYIVQIKETGDYYTIEEYIDGNFSKYSNNLGYVNESLYSYTLDSFSHWTYDKTGNYLMVSDLQGSKSVENETYILTDPAICCIEPQFTSTDLGKFGIIKFFEKHKCNNHCQALQLIHNEWQPEEIREIHSKATKISSRIEIKSKILNTIKDFKTSQSIDICFLVDITGSMGTYKSKVTQSIKSAYEELNKSFGDLKLRISFVGYRDYTSMGNDSQGRIEKFDFTSKIADLDTFLGKLIFNGGGDQCEDVIGGLEQVNKLSWRNQKRVLYHICDSPCHGKRFHSDDYDDDHPDGDPKKLDLSHLLKNLRTKEINYYFIEINTTTRKMIEEFNKELADGSDANFIKNL